MIVQTNTTNEDWIAYSKFIRRRVMHGAKNRAQACLLCVCFGVVLGLTISIGKFQIDLLNVGIGFFGFAFLIVIFTRSQLKNMQPASDGIVLGQHSITIDYEGIRASGINAESLFRWKAVRSAAVTDGHIFIMVDNTAAIIVPRRSFTSDSEREGFLNEIQKHVSP
jgi:hypothetical protein